MNGPIPPVPRLPGPPRITSTPGIMGGEPCIDGTRVPVASILGCWLGGDPAESIYEETYPRIPYGSIELAEDWARKHGIPDSVPCRRMPLARLAEIDLGFGEITHVNFRGLAGCTDPVVARWCVEQDAVLVTNNARDFRRIYRTLAVRPGLVIILPRTLQSDQIALLTIVVARWRELGDSVNKIIEIDLAGTIVVSDWPPLT